MSEIERREFNCRVGEHELTLRLGNCAVVLFRAQQEVDYLAVDLDDEEGNTLRVFNNPDLVRWMAGYRIIQKEGNIFRQAILSFNGEDQSFRERTGWNPPVIDKELPNENELEMFMDVNASSLDAEWQAGL